MDGDELKRKAEAWLAADPDPLTQAELRSLLNRPPSPDLNDRFIANLEFGTAGLRGVLGAGPNRMNRAVVRRTTAGLARYLKAHVPDAASRGIVVGRDGRTMSPELAHDTAAVLAAEGIPTWVFEDPVPTPLTAFATVRIKAAGAVMVTASHNPPEYNGYKVYWGNGAQIIPPVDKGIAAAIAQVEDANRVPLLEREGATQRGLWHTLGPEVGRAYLDAILALRLQQDPPPRLRIVYTAMHGVGGRWAVEALSRAGFDVIPVPEQQQPDGAFPTVRFPNPEEPGALDFALAMAERERGDLVLANDPDADRLAVAARDASGALRPLTGNEAGVLLGHYLLTQGPDRVPKPLVITTLVSSAQLGRMARELGAAYDETLTGFKWIANRALEREAKEGETFLFGYEEALGYTVRNVARDKDGIGAAVVFADLAGWCARRGTTVLGYLEEIQRRFGLYESSQRGVTFLGSQGPESMRALMTQFRERPPREVGGIPVEEVRDYAQGGALPATNMIIFALHGGSRITLRPSGTEPKMKYYFELQEPLSPGEPMEQARARARGKLTALEHAWLGLARERGQPA